MQRRVLLTGRECVHRAGFTRLEHPRQRYTALILLTLSMLLGPHVASPSWPGFLTNELHAFLTLVALIFIAIHLATTVIDPYIHFGITGTLRQLPSCRDQA
jgi:hypothetical protein